MGYKRPMESMKDSSHNDYSAPGPSSNAPSVTDTPSHPMQPAFDLLAKIKEIISKEFPSVKSEFDHEILERGINNGYYINLDEFKIATRQVLRSLAKKHKELNMTCKLLPFTNNTTPFTSFMVF